MVDNFKFKFLGNTVQIFFTEVDRAVVLVHDCVFDIQYGGTAMYAEQVGKLGVGCLRHQDTARLNNSLVVDGFKDIIQRTPGEVVGINTGEHRFRHIVFHKNKGFPLT